MMSSTSRTRYPFTTSQWQELEHQALIFKYMISGMPIPPHLLCIIRRSFDSSSLLHHHQPPQMGWSYYQMGSGKKVDPEPGRCRRTDGKKWRCSKEAYPDSKYCERHMHRGRNRSRKPVELITTSSSSTISSPKTMSVSSYSINSNSSPTISPSSSSTHHSLYNNLKSFPFESHQFTTSATVHNLWDSPAFSHISKGYSHEREGKEEVNEIPFFSENCGTLRIGSSDINNSLNHQRHSSLKIQSQDEDSSRQKHVFLDYLGLNSDVKDNDKPRKVMHHFFDEWPLKDKDSSWFDCNDDKLSRHASSSSSEIQLSISMPNSSSDNLFFARKNEK